MVQVSSDDQPEPSTLHEAYAHPPLSHVNCPAHHFSSFDSGSSADGANVRTLAMISSAGDKFVCQG
jgi:hypothetical protein